MPQFTLKEEEEFPIKRSVAYFNNASYTPMSTSARTAITEALENYSTNGPSDEYYLRLKEGGNQARERLSKLLNVRDKNEIVFTESATQGINLVANGFRLSKDDEYVIIRGGANEHPSNFLPWKYYMERKNGHIADLATDNLGLPDLSEMDSLLKKTGARLVVMSHVLYNFGTVMPVMEVSKIVHEHGARFFLDMSQSVGSIQVDLGKIGCDFAAGTAAKWLCGPLGLGFFYCKHEALDDLEPLNFGPNSCTYTPQGSFKPFENAMRLQEGFRNWAYCFGLVAAIDLIEKFGLSNIREKNIQLADSIIEGLKPQKRYSFIGSTDEPTRTSIIPLETSGIRPIEIVQKLSKSNIAVAEREAGEKKILRISPHFYNDEEEVAHLLEELARALI